MAKDTMTAVGISEFGGPDVMRPIEIPVPTVGKDQGLVAIESAGINFSDVAWRTGRRGGTPPLVLGSEGAGTLVALGEGVTGFQSGDRVAYWNPALGSYAQYALCPAMRLVKIPDEMAFETGAAMMLQGFTAHYLVRSVFPIERGQSLLFHAGAGGVGQIVIQIAKARGARVLVTVGTQAKADFAKSLGADEAILYDEVDFVQAVHDLTNGEGVDVVYDAVGAATWEGSIKAAKRRGMVVYFGNASGPIPPMDLGILARSGSLRISRTNLIDFVTARDEIEWRAEELFDLWRDGKLKIKAEHIYPLVEASQAHADLEARKTSGKILLKP